MDNFVTYFIFFSIITLTFIAGWIARVSLSRIIRKSTQVMHNDPTNYKFIKHIIVGLIYLIGFGVAVYQLPALRTLAHSMLAGAGILAVVIGFASQHALSNVISGLFIVIFKPFRINDRLMIQTHQGIVEDITLRHTVIRNFENRRIVIPNTIISDEIIINADMAEEKICKWIEIGISYNSDIDLAKSIMFEEVLNNPLYVDYRNEEMIAEGAPEVVVRVIGLGESSVNLRAWAWAKDAADAFILGCDLFESIKKRFDAEGVEIPYPHRTVYHRLEENSNLTNLLSGQNKNLEES